MTRSINIDEYVRDAERTVVLIRRPDNTVGAHDLHTGALLGVVDPKDYRDEDRIQVHEPGHDVSGAFAWPVLIAGAFFAVYFLLHVGAWIARAGN